jgi:hypothetical protein
MASKQNNTSAMTQNQLDQVNGGVRFRRASTMKNRKTLGGKSLLRGARILKSRVLTPQHGSMVVVVPN